MKKILFGIILLPLISISQNSIFLATLNNAATATISPMPNGSTYTVLTTVGAEIVSKFRFFNTSSSNTYTYNAIRTVKQLNASASTFFCVGATCLPPTGNTLTNPGDLIVLTPGANSDFITYLDESPTATGYSEVYYKIFNTTNPNDTLSITVIYNPSLASVKENKSVFESINVYPQPSQNFINIKSRLNIPIESACIRITNILGANVLQQTIHPNDLKIEKSIDISDLETGIYFLTIQSDKYSITKKIIISK